MHFCARAKVAHGFADSDFEVACRRIACESELLDFPIACPSEGNGLAPGFFVAAIAYRTLDERTIASILARIVVNAVKLVDAAQVEQHFEGHSLALAPLGVPAALGVKIKEVGYGLARLVFAGHACLDALDGKLKGISRGRHLCGGPFGLSVLIDGAHAEGIGRFGCQVFEAEVVVRNRGIAHAVKFHFVVIGVGLLLPLGRHFVGLYVGLGETNLGNLERARLFEQMVAGIKGKTLYGHLHVGGSHVILAQIDNELWILLDADLGKFAAGCGEAVEFGRSVIIICATLTLHFGTAVHTSESHLLAVGLEDDVLDVLRHVDAQFGEFLGLESVERAVCLADAHQEVALLVALNVDGRLRAGTCEVLLRLAVVVVVGKEAALLACVDFIGTIVGANLGGVVIGVGHRNDGTEFHEDGQLPQRRGIVVDNLAALVDIAVPVVHPFAFGQVDAVAHIVALLVHLGLLINRGHEEMGAKEVLVLGLRAQGIFIGIVEEHSANHRFAIHGTACDSIGVGHQFALEFEIPAVDASGRFAQRFGVFGIAAPAVHIEFHRREGFPLKFAHVDGHVLTAEDTIDITRDIGLAAQSRADEGRDMEANVLPVAACLVARPDTGIALRTGPAVQADDEGAGVRAVVGHNFADIGHTVQAETIACADPSHVGLEHTHASIAHFLDNVALQEGFDAFFRVEVALRPQADFHAFATGVFAKLAQVLNIAVEGSRLAIACSVAVVGEEPSQGHIVAEVAVDGGAGRELIVLSVGAVEGLADAAVVLLAFVVSLAVFVEHEAVFGGCPIVAVVGIEVALVEAELGQQHGVTRQLVEVAEQTGGCFVDHKEHIEVVLVVGENHAVRLRGSEVVLTGAERVPEDAIAARRPIERRGRGHTAVHPVVRILNGNHLALVREAAVLHTAAVEVILGVGAEGHRHLALLESHGLGPFNDHLVGIEVAHAEQARLAVNVYGQTLRADGGISFAGRHLKTAHSAAGIVHEDMGHGRGLRFAQDATSVVLEQAEDVCAVEIERQALAVGIDHLNGRGIDLADSVHHHGSHVNHGHLMLGMSLHSRRQPNGHGCREDNGGKQGPALATH